MASNLPGGTSREEKLLEDKEAVSLPECFFFFFPELGTLLGETIIYFWLHLFDADIVASSRYTVPHGAGFSKK